MTESIRLKFQNQYFQNLATESIKNVPNRTTSHGTSATLLQVSGRKGKQAQIRTKRASLTSSLADTAPHCPLWAQLEGFWGCSFPSPGPSPNSPLAHREIFFLLQCCLLLPQPVPQLINTLIHDCHFWITLIQTLPLLLQFGILFLVQFVS